MAKTWTVNDNAPPKEEKYEWHVPNNDQQHVSHTVTPGGLNLKPEDITLAPTLAPERSGGQFGWLMWNNQAEPTLGGWYVEGVITQEDD